jgi:ABC-2 type transport system ATP-binding protein
MTRTQGEDCAILAQGLCKRYDGGVTALAGIDLAVPPGIIYALLGPNGAGKTTLTSILTTIARSSEGSARVAGFDVARQAGRVRRSIGVTFQEMVLDDDLTGRQVLDYHGRLYAMKASARAARVSELLDLVELREAADRRVRGYSGGMKRRLELARALMTRPRILFLDEPTLGIDPQTRARIWSYVRDLKTRLGMTLLLTTHYMDEAEQLADRVGIIDRGRIVAEGAPRELIDRMGAGTIRMEVAGDAGGFVEALRGLAFVQSVAAGGGAVTLGVDEGSRRLSPVMTLAFQHGLAVGNVSLNKPNLEDVFFSYTGTMLREKQGGRE